MLSQISECFDFHLALTILHSSNYGINVICDPILALHIMRQQASHLIKFKTVSNSDAVVSARKVEFSTLGLSCSDIPST